jgi:O-antigen ligase
MRSVWRSRKRSKQEDLGKPSGPFLALFWGMTHAIQNTTEFVAPKSWAHRLALLAVGLTMAGGAIVFTEPSPFDVLGLGLVLLLPAIGLVKLTPGLIGYGAAALLPVACAFYAILAAIDPAKARTHTFVSLYLVILGLVLTAFVIKSPERHMRVILQGMLAAGLIAALAGLAGYLNAFPGAFEIFTLYGRASGTFKDPNVFGAFLVLPAVYLIHTLRTARGLKALGALLGFGILALAILLSFSRGGWFGLAVAASLYTALSFITVETAAERMRLTVGFGGVLIAGALLLMVALQFDAVSDLLSARASLTQSYDEGPEGRFGGQAKARALILAHPFGLGAQQFDSFYHLEEAHNVYLSMFMNAGWLGGLLYALLIAATVAAGARHALQRGQGHGPAQGLYLVAYAAFVAHALEGFIIDLDHWRHVHVLMALTWGMLLSQQAAMPAIERARIRQPRALRPVQFATA